jgi:hypothetical protein
LQKLGSSVVRLASNTDVADAPSGFRAFTREAAQRLNVFSAYTYTLETIIQAGHSNIRVLSVPIRTNPDLRPSQGWSRHGPLRVALGVDDRAHLRHVSAVDVLLVIATFFTRQACCSAAGRGSSSRVAARGMCSRRCSRRRSRSASSLSCLAFSPTCNREPSPARKHRLATATARGFDATPRVAPIRRARIEHRSAAGWQLLRQIRTTNPIAGI